MDRESLYARLPIALQNAALAVEGWRLKRLRFNDEFFAFLADYESRSLVSPQAVAEYRDRRLAEFVTHAATTVPHYRDLFQKHRLDPREIRTLSDLAALPILTKAEVQDAPPRFKSDAISPADSIQSHTSGSTGGGLIFPVTKRNVREQWAVWERYHRWHGLEMNTPCLYFGGRSVVPSSQRRPPFWRHSRATRQTFFSNYHLSAETAPVYLDAMLARAAPWVHGYPSFVALVASYAKQLGRKIPARWVTLGAENVLPQQAALVEEIFGVAPIQHYGMAEGVANISECPKHQLHVDEDFAAVEFIPIASDSSNSAPRQICHVVGTNFTNSAYPLLRYQVGDVVTLDPAITCDCGRPGRVVASIDGRQEDYIVTSAGTRIGRLDHVFKDMTNIREAQLFQQAAGTMTVRIVKGPCYREADERQLREEIIKRVGRDVTFDISYVEAIERTSRGKLRFVVSAIGQS